MCMLLLCGLAWGAEDFNVASCLQLNTVEHAAKEEYEKATMNMADDIRDVKKRIRKNQACAKKTRFTTLMTSAKKARVAEAHHVAAPRMSALKVKEKKPASTWTPHTWGEQADGYKATKRAFSGFNKEESKKKASFFSQAFFHWYHLQTGPEQEIFQCL